MKNCLNTTRLIHYADDAVMYKVGSSEVELQSSLQSDLNNISSWYGRNKLALNTRKNRMMLVDSSQRLKKLDKITLHLNGEVIQCKRNYKYLGAMLDENWSWKIHLNQLLKKLGHRLAVFH